MRTKSELQDLLKSFPLNELYWIRGRYCGPSNQLLSKRQFGYIMPIKDVDEEIATREFEKQVLGI